MKRLVFSIVLMAFLAISIASATTCDDSQTIMRLFRENNSHAALWDQNITYEGETYYTVRVCFDEIVGTNYTGSNPHECNSSDDIVLRLNKQNNSHVWGPRATESFGYDVCYKGFKSCTLVNASDCNNNRKKVAFLNQESYSHISKNNIEGFDIAVCCYLYNQIEPKYCDNVNSCSDYNSTACSKDECAIARGVCYWNSTSGKCEDSISEPDWCNVITSCANYTTSGNCTGNPCDISGGCDWNSTANRCQAKEPDWCNVITSCANYTTSGNCTSNPCNISVISGGCSWNSTANRCQDRVTPPDECDSINSCSDYASSGACENDACGIANSDMGCQSSDCWCEWYNGCKVAFESGGGSGGGGRISGPGWGGWGNPGCIYKCKISTVKGECIDGFMDVVVDASAEIKPGASCPGTAGTSPPDCQSKTVKGVPCELEKGTELPFFGVWQFVISVMGIAITYVILTRKFR